MYSIGTVVSQMLRSPVNMVSNVGKIATLPAAVTFSVSGAYKAMMDLATFFYLAAPDERLLVFAPKNAFGAWD